MELIEGQVELVGPGTADDKPLSIRTTNDGTPITGSEMPAGGSGKIGWLSAIWAGIQSIVSALATLVESLRATHTRLRPDQLFIERWGARTIGSSETLFTNADNVPAGYTPQNIEYTVPAGKIFFLKGLRVALDSPGNGTNVMLSLQVGVNKKIRMSLNTNSPSQGSSFDPAIPVEAGTPVQVWAHGSAGTTVTFVRFSGVEENA